MSAIVRVVGGPLSSPAGGVLSGTYPNPGFATDMATQAELDAEQSALQATIDALAARVSAVEGSTPNVPTVPGAPTIGTATSGNAQATVSFTAPTSNGGAAITSYTATSTPGGITGTGTSSPITVTGLTNGTAYTFKVKAANSAGTGADSAASNSVTPTTSTATIDVGVWAPDPYNATTWATELNAFESAAGHVPTIIYTYVGWGSSAPNFPAGQGNTITDRGAKWCLTWEPWNPSGTVNQPTYSLANIINGNFDTYITQFAQAIKNWGQPLLLRPAHEMNGDWYPWSEGVNGNSASGSGQYVQMWRHVRDIFTAQGVTNVSWVWCPMATFFTDPMGPLYPGDSYVDIVGLDGYNWGTTNGKTWTTFEQTFSQGITDIRAVTTSKPLHICEIGCSEVGGDKAAWITDMWTRLTTRTEISGFWWFNHNKETDWRIQSTTAAASAYATGVANSRYKSGTHAAIAKAATLTETFAATVSSSKWSTSGAATSTGGRLSLPLSTSYPGIIAARQYDLTSSQVTVELAQAPNAVTSSQAFLILNTPSANKTGLEFIIDAGTTLRARRWKDNVATEVASAAYNSTNHHRWRIREASGTTYWETSPDNTTWTTFTSMSTATLTGLGIALSTVTPQLGAGTWQAETNPGTALFDNVNA